MRLLVVVGCVSLVSMEKKRMFKEEMWANLSVHQAATGGILVDFSFAVLSLFSSVAARTLLAAFV